MASASTSATGADIGAVAATIACPTAHKAENASRARNSAQGELSDQQRRQCPQVCLPALPGHILSSSASLTRALADCGATVLIKLTCIISVRVAQRE